MPKYSVSVAADVIDTIEAASRDEAQCILIDRVNDLLSKGLKDKFSVIQNYMGDE